MGDIWSFQVETITGEKKDLSEHRGKVLLIVNVASRCGFTPQYEGLEKLWRKHKDRGLVVLGFPCDQFGHQEPGDEHEIATFCKSRYDVSFPLHRKIEVNGSNEHPLYTHLKSEKRGVLFTSGIKWNFTKFLVDRQGNVVDRFAPTTKPEALESKIEELL